jgi:hypothetical protein
VTLSHPPAAWQEVVYRYHSLYYCLIRYQGTNFMQVLDHQGFALWAACHGCYWLLYLLQMGRLLWNGTTKTRNYWYFICACVLVSLNKSAGFVTTWTRENLFQDTVTQLSFIHIVTGLMHILSASFDHSKVRVIRNSMYLLQVLTETLVSLDPERCVCFLAGGICISVLQLTMTKLSLASVPPIITVVDLCPILYYSIH